ncbi:MAG: hypothetical protein M0R74_09310 [Dehalococcoidia bacterium]|nr:hypothetical protein [Dehalococcoidia bacterium]
MRFVFLALMSALVVSACSGPGERTSGEARSFSDEERESAAAAPPIATPTPKPLTGWEILGRSDAAMETAGYVVTESYSWERDGRPLANDFIIVEETHGKTVRHLDPYPYSPATCMPYEMRTAPYTNRSEGALASYGSDTGATGPDDVELVGEELYEGEAAWVIRFRYLLPSVEGPFPREHTEWIAKDDYRLLRQELEVYDPYGFVGQTVVRFVEYEATPAKCPRPPGLTRDELRPLTTPRLENPYEYR